MKIASKILLTVLLLLSFSFPLADRAYAIAQITMVNRSQLTLNLYIDGNFGCGPVLGVGHFTNSPGLFCTSTVTPGPHRLEARNGDKVVQHEDDVNIGDGTSPTWTVNYEDPEQAFLTKINGARYLGHRSNEEFSSDEEVVINGTTLIWRDRITWARPEIARAMATGQYGWRQRQIGQWQDHDRLQLVGRVASKTYTMYNDTTYTITFTISEDANSILLVGPNLRVNLYRQ